MIWFWFETSHEPSLSNRWNHFFANNLMPGQNHCKQTRMNELSEDSRENTFHSVEESEPKEQWPPPCWSSQTGLEQSPSCCFRFPQLAAEDAVLFAANESGATITYPYNSSSYRCIETVSLTTNKCVPVIVLTYFLSSINANKRITKQPYREDVCMVKDAVWHRVVAWLGRCTNV